jgi:preprotein translocase subunit YajC
MLTSGIFGKISSVKEDRVELETSPGQKLTVAIGAISRVEQTLLSSKVSKTSSENVSKPKPKTPKADTRKK